MTKSTIPGIRFSGNTTQQLSNLGVVAVYLFGSRAEGTARPGSDYDFAFIMHDTRRITPYVGKELYQQLFDIVNGAITQRDFQTIDLVFLQRVPLYYTMNVLKYGNLLYDGDPRVRTSFEERARLMYMDFEPYRKELEAAALAMV